MSKPQLSFIVAIFFGTLSCSDGPETPAPTEDNRLLPQEFVMGVDLSYINQVEDHGGVFRENGVVVDPFETLYRHGANAVRVRIWHNPSWVHDLYLHDVPLYSGFEDVKKTIRRAKTAGMDVLLNFHYSDTWADPGKQDVPANWINITDVNVLADSVYNYTFKVLSRLNTEGLLPEMVQIGNETNCGMMFTNVPPGFPSLNVCQGNWLNFGRVINAGIEAVRDMDAITGKNTIIALHVADPRNIEWWLRDVINLGRVTDFEVMGFSYYHIWHDRIAFNDLPALITRLKSTYNRDFIVLETAYPFTTANDDNYSNIYFAQHPLEGFPYTVEGQRDFLISLTQNMMDAGAIGVFYWEPAWISSNMVDLWGAGSSWENCAFFNFSGNLTNVVQYLNWNYK